MNPDDPEEDRTVIRPTGSNTPTQAAGFQKTEWAAGNAIPSRSGGEKTQFAAPPSSSGGPDMAGNLPVGTRLGEFEITSLIGEGGFGIVYLAHDHSLQRRVALKEYMPSSLAARAAGSQVQVKSERHRETFEAGLKSFINEARLLASFDHPSLVKVYRFWEANGTAYMVMPFLEGTTLKDVLRGLPERPDEAWLRSVLGPLTEALLVIHSEQCYHRDIAPDNVMLLPGSNRWLLLDFGAARRVIGDMTQALTVILKPGYAPVEQYAEIPGMKQGPWTDVYALAAVVYFAIMGRTPPPSVGRLLNDTYIPLAQGAAGRYGDEFLSAIDRALAVRPEERTQTIGELRLDLGLGEAVFDNYATRPIPGNTEIPPRRAGATQVPTRAAPTGVATTTQKTAPKTAPRAATVPVPPTGGGVPAAPAAAARGKGALVGIGAGVVALATLGFGAYALLAPKPRPASDAVPVAAAPAAAGPVAPAAGNAAPASPAPAPPGAATTAGPATPAPVPAPSTAPVTAPVTAFDPSREFARVVQGQGAGYDLRLQTNKTTYRIGKDELSFSLQSEREGYVYVFINGPDGVLLQLYPNIKQGSLKIKKGQTLKLPQSPDVFETAGPAGPTDLLVMVSPRQRDHSALRPKKDGAYRVFPTGPEAGLLLAQISGPVAPMAGRAICPSAGPCDDEYGAALVRVEVVP